MLRKRGYFQTGLRENLHIWNGTKKKNFDGLFCHFLGIKTHNFVKSNLKFENKCLFHANFMELEKKKCLDLKAVTFGVWGLKLV